MDPPSAERHLAGSLGNPDNPELPPSSVGVRQPGVVTADEIGSPMESDHVHKGNLLESWLFLGSRAAGHCAGRRADLDAFFRRLVLSWA